MKKRIKSIIAMLIICFFSCKEESRRIKVLSTKPKIIVQVDVPIFNQDSAYQYIQAQVDFGPRVPNSQAHLKCANWLDNKLKSFGAKTLIQKGKVTAFNGDRLAIQNIIGQFNPEKKNRILLFAHWDTRPVADKDVKDRNKPIDGANDGGSGVGVLLEIARQFQQKEPSVGVDIIFFDAEDYGIFNGSMLTMEDSWCLGSQYWAKNPPIKNYRPRYGILLDLVGEKNAQFPKEYTGIKFAPNVINKVWNTAQKLGYSKYFINQQIGGIIDDHVYVNKLADIPSIDIIGAYPNSKLFGDYHHTHADNMRVIDKNTLKAVGQTVMNVVYQEK